ALLRGASRRQRERGHPDTEDGRFWRLRRQRARGAERLALRAAPRRPHRRTVGHDYFPLPPARRADRRHPMIRTRSASSLALLTAIGWLAAGLARAAVSP